MSKKKAVKKTKTKTINIQAQAIDKCLDNAQRNAQPGIIAAIMQSLVKAKESKAPRSVDEILNDLVKRFPDRERGKMAITVRAQLHRLPFQKNFAIEKVRDGRCMRYAAA